MTDTERILQQMQENSLAINQRLDRMESKIDNLEQRFDGLEQRFDGLEQRFDGLEQRFDNLENRFDVLEQRFDNLEQRFDGLEQRFDDLENRFNDLTVRVDNLEIGLEHEIEKVYQIAKKNSEDTQLLLPYKDKVIHVSTVVDKVESLEEHQKITDEVVASHSDAIRRLESMLA